MIAVAPWATWQKERESDLRVDLNVRGKLCLNLPIGSGYTEALVAASAYKLEAVEKSRSGMSSGREYS